MRCTTAQNALILAVLMGALAVVAGGQVLLGRDPGYTVIGWLPVYNVIAGLAALLIAAPLIWCNSAYIQPVALLLLFAHTIVMAILLASYRDQVAFQSLVAMTIRLIAWVVILFLLRVQARRDRATTHAR